MQDYWNLYTALAAFVFVSLPAFILRVRIRTDLFWSKYGWAVSRGILLVRMGVLEMRIRWIRDVQSKRKQQQKTWSFLDVVFLELWIGRLHSNTSKRSMIKKSVALSGSYIFVHDYQPNVELLHFVFPLMWPWYWPAVRSRDTSSHLHI